MIELASRTYFFVHKGQIVHTPRRFGSDKQLPDSLGDESNSIKTDDAVELPEDNVNFYGDDSVLIDVGSMNDTQFDLHLKKLR